MRLEKITARIKTFLKGEGIYWLGLVAILIVIELTLWRYFIPSKMIGNDLGFNLMSEVVGILFTIVFITWLFRLREKSQWKTVEEGFKRKLSLTMLDLFMKIQILLDPILVGKSTDVENLKKLASLEKVKMNIAYEVILTTIPKVEEVLSSRSLKGTVIFPDTKFSDTKESPTFSALSKSSQKLWALETGYLRFFDVNLRGSVMKIQDLLENILGWFEVKAIIIEKAGEDLFLDKMASMVHDIIKEINNMYEVGYIEWA